MGDFIQQNAGDYSIQIGTARDVLIGAASSPPLGSAPPLPPLVVGREGTLADLKERLIVTDEPPGVVAQALVVIRGWPGVGKTTVAAAIAHDRGIANAFPDGVLWVSLDREPSLFSKLISWGRALGIDGLLHAGTLEEAATQLSALLRNKRMLLIIDDVWEPEHAIPFNAGGRRCGTLITTRESRVAQALAPTTDQVYKLPGLTEEKSFELLERLAPSVVSQLPEESKLLGRELEGLPLALQVAGRLLNAEAIYGFGVKKLLAELQEGTNLLQSRAPADRTVLASETTPTVAVLLQKSTDRLDPETHNRFAFLGAFAPKPATFDLAAMKAIWQVDDPKPTARVLVDHGLLEPVSPGRFQMHALLVLHARSLLTEE